MPLEIAAVGINREVVLHAGVDYGLDFEEFWRQVMKARKADGRYNNIFLCTSKRTVKRLHDSGVNMQTRHAIGKSVRKGVAQRKEFLNWHCGLDQLILQMFYTDKGRDKRVLIKKAKRKVRIKGISADRPWIRLFVKALFPGTASYTLQSTWNMLDILSGKQQPVIQWHMSVADSVALRDIALALLTNDELNAQKVSQICAHSNGISARLDLNLICISVITRFSDPIFSHTKYAVIGLTLCASGQPGDVRAMQSR